MKVRRRDDFEIRLVEKNRSPLAEGTRAGERGILLQPFASVPSNGICPSYDAGLRTSTAKCPPMQLVATSRAPADAGLLCQQRRSRKMGARSAPPHTDGRCL